MTTSIMSQHSSYDCMSTRAPSAAMEILLTTSNRKALSMQEFYKDHYRVVRRVILTRVNFLYTHYGHACAYTVAIQ